ncbi:MAG: hypothetical protein U0T84_02555 [Chitinophagales bacterium]
MKKKVIIATSLIAFAIIIALILSIGFSTYQYINNPTAFTNNKAFVPTDTTEVIVLGTLHQHGAQVSFDSLYNALEKIKPNVILFEMDSTGFDETMNLKNSIYSMVAPEFLSKWQPKNLEEMACKKYQHFNPSAVIRPYEWSGRDKFHKTKAYTAIEAKCFPEMHQLYHSKKLRVQHENIFRAFLSLTQQLNGYSDSTLAQINTKAVDSLAKSRQYLHYKAIKQIVDSNENLKDYKAYFQPYSSYWETRNNEMVKNICRYIKLNPGSRIVVLNGYFHRYFLLEKLRLQQAALNFKVVE